MKVLLAGDTHGTSAWMDRLFDHALVNDCAAIVQLGDFGYWEHTEGGRRFLRHVEKLLLRRGQGMKFYWLDGNHESHTLLRARYGPGGTHHVPDEHGFWEIRSNLYYMPRCSRWEWDGVSFQALGGAYSIDKDPKPEWGWTGRVEGFSWWPEEMITDEEVNLAIAEITIGGCVDVMLTHDCPAGVDPPSLRGHELFPDAELNRERLRRVVDVARPTLLVHGHLHDRHTLHLDLEGGHTVQIEGLSCEWRQGSWSVLDLKDIKPQ